MQPGPDALRRLIVANAEHAAFRLNPGCRAPAGDERARERSVDEIDRHSIVNTPRIPDGVVAHPSVPQFSSSQAVISAWRRPKPPGGTAILMRTGKRRSAMVMISRGLPGIFKFPLCSYTDCTPV